MLIWRNLSVDTKLLWNQPSRIGRCATLIGYPSMFFVNTLYVGHVRNSYKIIKFNIFSIKLIYFLEMLIPCFIARMF
jgi:hypothetical protein